MTKYLGRCRTMNELQQIINTYPSTCYTCELSRKPTNEGFTRKGWVGCCLRVLNAGLVGRDYEQIEGNKNNLWFQPNIDSGIRGYSELPKSFFNGWISF
jgi:hypothetical protein